MTIQFSTGDLGGQNRGRGGAILTPNELVLTFRGSYVCANFGENRSKNATVRVLADGQTRRQTDANRFYNLSHAICYSYGTDKKNRDYSAAQLSQPPSRCALPYIDILSLEELYASKSGIGSTEHEFTNAVLRVFMMIVDGVISDDVVTDAFSCMPASTPPLTQARAPAA